MSAAIRRITTIGRKKNSRTGQGDDSTLNHPASHVPLEIWLYIFDILGPSEQKAFSCTCRTFFALVNRRSSLAFQVLRLYGDKLPDLLKLFNHSRLLQFAREVHWLPSRTSHVQARSGGELSLTRLSIQYVLSKLSHSTTIRTLYLHRIDIRPPQQRLILSISSLRHLTLHQSIFIPENRPMPPTLIESFSFGTGTVSPEPATHVLRLLAKSLKALDVGNASEVLYPLMNTLQFARLTNLRQHATTYLHHFYSLSCHTSITELYIGPGTSQQWVIPVDYFQAPHLLPHLQRLSSPWRVAVRIIPGRPVKVFHDTELLGGSDKITVLGRLRQLARSTAEQGMEQIRMCHNIGVIGLVCALNTNVPHLKRLEVFVRDHHPLQLEGWRIGCNSSIIEIEIRFLRPTRESLLSDERAYPEQPCRTLFITLAEVCHKLEQMTFLAANSLITDGGSVFDENEQDIPSDCKLKFRKTSKGTWEERMWGIEDRGNIIMSL